MMMSDLQNNENAPQDVPRQTADTGVDAMDEWSQAMAEQQQATLANAEQDAQAHGNVFKPLAGTVPAPAKAFDIDLIKDIPVQLSVELGRARITIRDLLQLSQGSVVELSNLAGEPMDILINGFLIAQGEVVVVGDHYGVRLTDIVTPSERLSRLSAKR